MSETSDQTCSFGIMSTAAITTKVIPSMHTIIGVGSRDPAKAQAFCERHANLPKGTGGCGIGMTYDELVADPRVDALYVPLPTGLRNDWIKKGIAAGKHIYSEKPMGGTAKELNEILDSCAAHNLQFMDGTMWYHSTRTKEIEKLLRSGELGKVCTVIASFTFPAENEEWLNGGNGRTDKSREPMGCLGDQGWYPLSAILWAFDWELPTRVMATSTTFNNIDTIVACQGVLWFADGRIANFECGCTKPHRSQYEIVCEKGVIKVDDLVGGQGRSGDFGAYERTFSGSIQYVRGDVMGKDEIVEVPACDHVDALVDDFSSLVTKIKAGGKPDPDWPRRSLVVHTTICAIFESALNGGNSVDVSLP